jgi:hypothetical protein
MKRGDQHPSARCGDRGLSSTLVPASAFTVPAAITDRPTGRPVVDSIIKSLGVLDVPRDRDRRLRGWSWLST